MEAGPQSEVVVCTPQHALSSHALLTPQLAAVRTEMTHSILSEVHTPSIFLHPATSLGLF